MVTSTHHPRALEPIRLATEFSNRGIRAEVVENAASAVELALGKAKAGDLICATGSIFIVAEVMEYLKLA
jgi:folylpolyglutamate synthase/dihydropteroate synthase